MSNSSAGKTTKYQDVILLLKDQIRSGIYGEEGRIPTEQELADAFRVSRNTVRQAVAILQEEGFVYRRQGSGTYVAKLKQGELPRRRCTSLVMMAVDVEMRRDSYDFAQMAIAERWLSERGVALTSANLCTADLVQGREPAILAQGHCQGLLFDGWVTDIHCALAERYGLPYVVVGNHPVSAVVPQVRLDPLKIMNRIVSYLSDMRPGQPVALLVRETNLHFIKEILNTYIAVAQQLPQREAIVQFATEEETEPAIDRLFERHAEPFSLITMEIDAARVARSYRRRQIDPEKYPVVAIANPKVLEPEDRTHLHVLPYSVGDNVIEALTNFLEAYAVGNRHFRVDVDPGAILPAQRIFRV